MCCKEQGQSLRETNHVGSERADFVPPGIHAMASTVRGTGGREASSMSVLVDDAETQPGAH